MLSFARRRLTFANVAMTLALVFAMSGGAYAAKKYLITSTKQISPKVLKSLQGKAGPAGGAGPQGPAGPVGPQGPAGPAGAAGTKGETGPEGKEGKEGKAGKDGKNGLTGFTETLTSGKTEKGTWAASGAPVKVGGFFPGLLVPISFVIPLAVAPEPHVIGIEEGEGEAHQSSAIPSECTGTVASPGAKGGQLCVFINGNQILTANLKSAENIPGSALIYDSGGEAGDAANPGGATVDVLAENESKPLTAVGTWAVTAE
jgi:hypothetical protein